MGNAKGVNVTRWCAFWHADAEAGEGVISTAIAVLIMALIGAGMWLVFSGVISQAEERIRSAVLEIGE